MDLQNPDQVDVRVPVHEIGGGRYVREADVPAPLRSALQAFALGQTCLRNSEGDLLYPARIWTGFLTRLRG